MCFFFESTVSRAPELRFWRGKMRWKALVLSFPTRLSSSKTEIWSCRLWPSRVFFDYLISWLLRDHTILFLLGWRQPTLYSAGFGCVPLETGRCQNRSRTKRRCSRFSTIFAPFESWERDLSNAVTHFCQQQFCDRRNLIIFADKIPDRLDKIQNPKFAFRAFRSSGIEYKKKVGYCPYTKITFVFVRKQWNFRLHFLCGGDFG